MKARPVWLSLILIAVTIGAGLALRMAPLGLPRFIVKYGGSAMWALMIYWLVTTLLPSIRIFYAALLAGCIATGVEFFKLYHSPNMDAFRGTLAGMLLLGRYFSIRDIVAYWIAIVAGGLVDAKLRSRQAVH